MAEKEASASANSAAAVTISSEIMVATVIFLFMVVAFVFVLYLYAKRYVGANPVLGRSRTRPRFVFAAELAPCGGLHPAVLTALPVAAYRVENYKEGLECAVCLSEVSEGERIRLLPDCDHGFHVECIDMWFHSHSTCPLCRTLVAARPADPAAGSAGIRRPQDVSGNGSSRESPALPTNVLFWGIQGGVSAQEGASSSSGSSSSSSSSSTRKDTRKEEGVLMIEIPRRCFPGSPAPISPLEEIKSPSLARLRSLKRLLSRGKQATGASCSPLGGDIV